MFISPAGVPARRPPSGVSPVPPTPRRPGIASPIAPPIVPPTPQTPLRRPGIAAPQPPPPPPAPPSFAPPPGIYLPPRIRVFAAPPPPVIRPRVPPPPVFVAILPTPAVPITPSSLLGPSRRRTVTVTLRETPEDEEEAAEEAEEVSPFQIETEPIDQEKTEEEEKTEETHEGPFDEPVQEWSKDVWEFVLQHEKKDADRYNLRVTPYNRYTFPSTKPTWHDQNGTQYLTTGVMGYYHFKLRNSKVALPNGRLELVHGRDRVVGIASNPILKVGDVVEDEEHDVTLRPQESIVCGMVTIGIIAPSS